MQQVASLPLLANHIIPLELTELSYRIIFIVESYYLNRIEVKRRCNCRLMIVRQGFQRQASIDGMLVSINNDDSSAYIHFNHAYF